MGLMAEHQSRGYPDRMSHTSLSLNWYRAIFSRNHDAGCVFLGFARLVSVGRRYWANLRKWNVGNKGGANCPYGRRIIELIWKSKMVFRMVVSNEGLSFPRKGSLPAGGSSLVSLADGISDVSGGCANESVIELGKLSNIPEKVEFTQRVNVSM